MRAFLTILKLHYRLIGNKLFLLILLMLTVVGLQGLGLGLFVPILQGEKSDSKITLITKDIFNFVGIEYCLLNLLLLLVLFFFFRSVCMMGQTIVVTKFLAELMVNLRHIMTEKIFHMDYQAYIKKTSGFINNALIVELPGVVSSFKTTANLIVNLLFIVLYVGLPLLLNPFLVFILALIGLPSIFVIRKINLLTRNYSVKTSAHSAGLQKILIQSLNSYKYLKATAEYPRVLQQMSRQNKMLGKLQVKQGILGSITQYGFEPFVVLIVAGLVFYFVKIMGQDIIEKLFLLYLLYNAMLRILQLQGSFRKLLGTWGSINVYMKLERELETLKEKKADNATFHPMPSDPTVRFKNVSFSYNSRDKVLDSLCLEIPANQTVAFVGESGAGKTTLANMIVSLFRPVEGLITMGDVPYTDIDPEQLRRQIGYITQENVIFSDTVYNNITLWDDRTDDNVQRAAEAAGKAHLAQLVEGLDNRYDSLLGEGGINISGGQRQRICIARELYKDAKILIFDEATSSLDTKTEIEIQKNIDEFKGQKTVVVIAHRLSTVKNADKIFVLKEGVIAEEGTYEELYSLNGEFRKMVDQQNL